MLFLSQTIRPKCSRWMISQFENYIEENVNIVADKLKVNNNTDFITINVTVHTLELAAKVFTYLSYCPPKLLIFFDNLFKNASPKDILLALPSVQVHSVHQKEGLGKIFKKTMEILKLEHYKILNMLTQNDKNNTTLQYMNESDIVGKNINCQF